MLAAKNAKNSKNEFRNLNVAGFKPALFLIDKRQRPQGRSMRRPYDSDF